MQIAFDSKQLRAICEDDAIAVQALGDADAENLRKRLADLRAAESISDLLVGNPRLDTVHRLIVDIGTGRSLAFVGNHAKNPQQQDGSLDWSKTTRIRLVQIIDV